ncbi:MAG: response regulator [Bdellovibrionota bacterium]
MDKSLVMIIEDEVSINDALSEAVKMGNYDVVQAYDGKEALDLLIQKNIDPVLVLCDMNMPVMGGIEFIKQSLIKNMDLNICVITANDDKDSLVELLQLGVTDYISKPFKIEALIEKLKLMVDIGKRKNLIKQQLNENTAANKSIKFNNLLKLKKNQK